MAVCQLVIFLVHNAICVNPLTQSAQLTLGFPVRLGQFFVQVLFIGRDTD